MSVRLMSAIFESTTLAPTERLIMLSLADHADDEGRCYPSIRRLCQRTGLSERAVQSNLRKLQDQGYLKTVTGGGKGNANLYFVSANPAADAPRSRCTPAADAPQTPQQMHPNPAADAPEPSRTINQPSTTARDTAQPDVVDDAKSRREEVLGLMDLDASGVTPAGRFTGTTNDMAEPPKWDALGLSRSEQDAKIREMLERQRRSSPGFIPNGWRWFTAGMEQLAADKRRPAASGRQDAATGETYEQRRRRRAKMIGG